MNLKASENIQLYGMNYFFNEIATLYNEKKMPNKILLSGRKGIGKSTLAYHIINCILSQKEDYNYNIKEFTIDKKNISYKLIQNRTHPNFYLVDLIEEKKSIDIAQVRELITYTNKSSFNNRPRFILIDNIENLNKNSINALLKIIEEPNENIYFILISNNEAKILPTLRSRCLTFKINFSFNQSVNIINQLIKRDLFEIINYDLISYYYTPGDFIGLINFAAEKKIDLKQYYLLDFLILLIDNSYYKKNKFVKKLIFNLVELYFLKEYKMSSAKNSLLNIYHNFIDKIYNVEKFNLDEESLFLEFKAKLLNG